MKLFLSLIVLFVPPMLVIGAVYFVGYMDGKSSREVIYREEVKTTYLNADYKEVFEACTRELYKLQSK